MEKNRKLLGAFCVIMASVLWGGCALFVRELADLGWTTFDIIEARGILGALAVGLYMFIADKSLFKFDIKDIWIFIGTGILNMLLNAVCYFYCIQMTDVAIASSFNATGPMFALIFGWLIFKEKLTVRKGIAITLTFLGCILLCKLSGAEKITPVAILLGFGAGIGYSMYSVFSRFALNKNYNPFTITFYSLVISAIGIAFFTNWKVVAETAITVPTSWIWMLLIGIGDGFVGYMLYTQGLKYIETGMASILCSMELVTGAVIGLTIYHEALTEAVILGLFMIFAGIFVANYEAKRVTPIYKNGKK